MFPSSWNSKKPARGAGRKPAIQPLMSINPEPVRKKQGLPAKQPKKFPGSRKKFEKPPSDYVSPYDVGGGDVSQYVSPYDENPKNRQTFGGGGDDEEEEKRKLLEALKELQSKVDSKVLAATAGVQPQSKQDMDNYKSPYMIGPDKNREQLPFGKQKQESAFQSNLQKMIGGSAQEQQRSIDPDFSKSDRQQILMTQQHFPSSQNMQQTFLKGFPDSQNLNQQFLKNQNLQPEFPKSQNLQPEFPNHQNLKQHLAMGQGLMPEFSHIQTLQPEFPNARSQNQPKNSPEDFETHRGNKNPKSDVCASRDLYDPFQYVDDPPKSKLSPKINEIGMGKIELKDESHRQEGPSKLSIEDHVLSEVLEKIAKEEHFLKEKQKALANNIKMFPLDANLTGLRPLISDGGSQSLGKSNTTPSDVGTLGYADTAKQSYVYGMPLGGPLNVNLKPQPAGVDGLYWNQSKGDNTLDDVANQVGSSQKTSRGGQMEETMKVSSSQTEDRKISATERGQKRQKGRKTRWEVEEDTGKLTILSGSTSESTNKQEKSGSSRKRDSPHRSRRDRDRHRHHSRDRHESRSRYKESHKHLSDETNTRRDSNKSSRDEYRKSKEDQSSRQRQDRHKSPSQKTTDLLSHKTFSEERRYTEDRYTDQIREEDRYHKSVPFEEGKTVLESQILSMPGFIQKDSLYNDNVRASVPREGTMVNENGRKRVTSDFDSDNQTPRNLSQVGQEQVMSFGRSLEPQFSGDILSQRTNVTKGDTLDSNIQRTVGSQVLLQFPDERQVRAFAEVGAKLPMNFPEERQDRVNISAGRAQQPMDFYEGRNDKGNMGRTKLSEEYTEQRQNRANQSSGRSQPLLDQSVRGQDRDMSVSSRLPLMQYPDQSQERGKAGIEFPDERLGRTHMSTTGEQLLMEFEDRRQDRTDMPVTSRQLLREFPDRSQERESMTARSKELMEFPDERRERKYVSTSIEPQAIEFQNYKQGEPTLSVASRYPLMEFPDRRQDRDNMSTERGQTLIDFPDDSREKAHMLIGREPSPSIFSGQPLMQIPDEMQERVFMSTSGAQPVLEFDDRRQERDMISTKTGQILMELPDERQGRVLMSTGRAQPMLEFDDRRQDRPSMPTSRGQPLLSPPERKQDGENISGGRVQSTMEYLEERRERDHMSNDSRQPLIGQHERRHQRGLSIGTSQGMEFSEGRQDRINMSTGLLTPPVDLPRSRQGGGHVSDRTEFDNSQSLLSHQRPDPEPYTQEPPEYNVKRPIHHPTLPNEYESPRLSRTERPTLLPNPNPFPNKNNPGFQIDDPNPPMVAPTSSLLPTPESFQQHIPSQRGFEHPNSQHIKYPAPQPLLPRPRTPQTLDNIRSNMELDADVRRFQWSDTRQDMRHPDDRDQYEQYTRDGRDGGTINPDGDRPTGLLPLPRGAPEPERFQRKMSYNADNIRGPYAENLDTRGPSNFPPQRNPPFLDDADLRQRPDGGMQDEDLQRFGQSGDNLARRPLLPLDQSVFLEAKNKVNDVLHLMTNEKSGVCGFCKAVYDETFTHALLLHMCEEHVKYLPYVCPICNERLFSYELINLHMHSHDSSNANAPNNVQQPMIKPLMEPDHVGIPPKRKLKWEADSDPKVPKHGEQRNLDEIIIGKGYKCKYCQNWIKNSLKDVNHEFKCGKGKYEKCAFCHESFELYTPLKRHLKRQHVRFLPFSCRICKEAITEIEYVNDHMKAHRTGRNKNPNPSEKNEEKEAMEGDESEVNIPDMEKDIIVYMEKKPDEKIFQCQKCPESFPQLYFFKLKSHVTAHRDKEFSSVCGFCDEFFQCERNLKNHLSKHVTSLPHPCDCGYKADSVLTANTHEIKFHLSDEAFKAIKTRGKRAGFLVWCTQCRQEFPSNSIKYSQHEKAGCTFSSMYRK